YKHSFPTAGKEITADITYNNGKRNNNSSILNEYFNIDGTVSDVPNRVNNFGASNGNQLTFQVDYVNPISDEKKIEMGIRSFTSNDENIFDAFALQNGSSIKLPLSSNYNFKERVNAAYITY